MTVACGTIGACRTICATASRTTIVESAGPARRFQNCPVSSASDFDAHSKGSRVNPSLGIVLPVCNAEATLRQQVQELLEIVPDLSSRFEVLIVDNASTDGTEEIARELATTYPQIKVMRHRQQLPLQRAADLARRTLETDVVLVHDVPGPLRAADVRLAIDHPLPKPYSSTRQCSDSAILRRLVEWARALERAQRGPSTTGPSKDPPADMHRTLRRRATV